MTATEQRVALAKWLGWRVTCDEHFKHLCRPGDKSGVCCGKHLSEDEIFAQFFVLGECGPDYVIPDFLNDLNAVHEAEAKLDEKQRVTYLMRLSQPFPSAMPLDPNYAEEQWVLVRSAAAQRCEALLRCLSLWRD